MCSLISDDCFGDCMSLDSRCMLLWWMCSTDCDYMSLIKYMCATWCGSVPLDCSCVLLWIDTVVFYWMILFWLPWRISAVIGNDYQLEGQIFSRRKKVQDIYSSRTYVWIRIMVLVSLYGVSVLFNIMFDYSYGVWFRKMMVLMI